MNEAPLSQASNTPTAPDRRKRLLSLLLRVGITVGALAWVLSTINLSTLGEALARISPIAMVVGVLIFLGNLWIGAVRWRVLLSAYGAKWRPSLLMLWRVYLIAIFYNTALPANVGGDVMRGYVTRRAFPGKTGAYLVVAIERVFGLAGVFSLAAVTLLVHPIPTIPHITLYAFVGMLLAAVASASPLVARRLAPWLPHRLRTVAELLPTVQKPALLLVVLFLSMCTQFTLALTGHVLLHTIDPSVPLGTSVVLIPLAMVAIYLPTVAGLGTREAAFVYLLGAVGVAKADALAASFAMFAAQLITALLGGLTHLVAPLPRLEAED